MLLKTLQQTHPELDIELLRDYRALYRGGAAFKARVNRFLLRREQEQPQTYAIRCAEAHYRSYLGSIINQFGAMLVSSPIEIRAKAADGSLSAPDPAYAALKEDCDGAGTDLIAFVRKRAIDAMVARRAWWRLERPNFTPSAQAQNLADWEQQRLGDVVLVAAELAEVRDWSLDRLGNLLEVLTYCCESVRPTMRQPRGKTRHTWQIWDATTVETFSVDVEDGAPIPEDVPGDGGIAHGFSRLPWVCLDLGDELWIADRLASPQLEHFRQSNALGWGIRTTCYAMPVFKMFAGADGKAAAPVMGAGNFLVVGADEDVTWLAPPGDHFAVVQKEIESQKDEIYRVAQQLAQGVNNNAAAVGRSGASKLADAEATRIVLEALGQPTREAIEKSFDIAANGRGDKSQFSIEGLGGAELYDVVELTSIAPDVETANIPSPTFQREWKTRLAFALVPGADAETKDTIREEIEEGVPDEPPDPVTVATMAAAQAGKLLAPMEPDGDEASGSDAG